MLIAQLAELIGDKQVWLMRKFSLASFRSLVPEALAGLARRGDRGAGVCRTPA